MDNVTHSLAGLALARAGLDDRSGYGTATLILGANLPDVDGLLYFFGTSTGALAFRRGWTHGLLAMVVLPLLLTLSIAGLARLSKRPVNVRRIALLAAIGVWSHPLLDWLNTYGVRFLMPFSGRWFYGDALFIIDPWLWLLLTGGVLLARGRRQTPTRAALLAGALYVSAMITTSRLGVATVEREAGGEPARRTLVSPVFLDPLRRQVVRDLGGEYEEGELVLGWRPRYSPAGRTPVGRELPGVAAASATAQGAAFLSWARFPRFESERRGDSLRVTISDMRYGKGPAGSWATLVIEVPAARPAGGP